MAWISIDISNTIGANQLTRTTKNASCMH